MEYEHEVRMWAIDQAMKSGQYLDLQDVERRAARFADFAIHGSFDKLAEAVPVPDCDA